MAIKFNINAVKYLIPENKKIGKFEKFGFYCDTCDAYMTGQIQLVMVSVYLYLKKEQTLKQPFINILIH